MQQHLTEAYLGTPQGQRQAQSGWHVYNCVPKQLHGMLCLASSSHCALKGETALSEVPRALHGMFSIAC
jgi:hypothetical protein